MQSFDMNTCFTLNSIPKLSFIAGAKFKSDKANSAPNRTATNFFIDFP